MDICDISWDTFTKTGKVDAYLIYKIMEKEGIREHGRHKGKRDSIKTKGIW